MNGVTREGGGGLLVQLEKRKVKRIRRRKKARKGNTKICNKLIMKKLSSKKLKLI